MVQIGQHFKDGYLHKNEFKIVYVAPMKVSILCYSLPFSFPFFFSFFSLMGIELVACYLLPFLF